MLVKRLCVADSVRKRFYALSVEKHSSIDS